MRPKLTIDPENEAPNQTVVGFENRHGGGGKISITTDSNGENYIYIFDVKNSEPTHVYIKNFPAVTIRGKE